MCLNIIKFITCLTIISFHSDGRQHNPSHSYSQRDRGGTSGAARTGRAARRAGGVRQRVPAAQGQPPRPALRAGEE